MNTDKEEAMKRLLGQDMDKEEAKKFLDGRKVVTKGIQLPAEQALNLMNQMSKYGIFTGPVRFYVVVTEDNEQRLLDLLNSTGHDVAVEDQFDVAKMSKDPIGDYNRRIQDGYAGTAAFADDDTKLVN